MSNGMERGYEPNWEAGEIVPLGTPIFLRRVMIEEDLGLPTPDDPETACLRKIIREELMKRFGPEGNCGSGCRLGKCGRTDCEFPYKQWRANV
jgi:hypothetical protein